MKEVLKQINSTSEVFGSKPQKKLSTYRIDDETKRIADRVIVIRTLINGSKPEPYTKLIRNLIKEEFLRLKEEIKNNDILQGA
jgi:hypothetical protein